jgi:hypothetical protein
MYSVQPSFEITLAGEIPFWLVRHDATSHVESGTPMFGKILTLAGQNRKN